MALKFDGSNDFGSVSIDLSQWSKMTACFWVDMRSTATDVMVEHSANANTNNGGFGFFTNDGATNTMAMACRGTGAGGKRFPFTANTGWHHVAWQFSTSAFAIDAGYLDGVAQSLTAYGTGGGSAAFRNDTMYFGARSGLVAPFDGGFADLMLFPGDYLTAEEIQEIARGMMPQRQPYLRAFASDNPFQPSNGSLIQRPIVWTGGGPAEMNHPSIIEYEPLVRGRFGPSAGGATIIDLTSASFGFTGNSNQPSVRSSLTQASFDFTANPIQPKTTLGLTAAAFNFTANAINLGGQTIIDLSRASFNFTANAINVVKDTAINLTTAAFSFVGKVINISTPPIPGGSSGGGMFMALAGFFKKRRYRQKVGKHE